MLDPSIKVIQAGYIPPRGIRRGVKIIWRIMQKMQINHENLTVPSIFEKVVTFDHNLTHLA